MFYCHCADVVAVNKDLSDYSHQGTNAASHPLEIYSNSSVFFSSFLCELFRYFFRMEDS